MVFSSLEWKKLRVIFIYHVISLFHLQIASDMSWRQNLFLLEVFGSKCSAAHSMHRFLTHNLKAIKSEGCVDSCAAQVPEESHQTGWEDCDISLQAECPPAAGRFLSPFSGCDAPPRTVYRSSPAAFSAPNLTPASEIDAQIPDEDKGKICVSFTAKCHLKLAIEVAWRCVLEHKRKPTVWKQNSDKKPVLWLVNTSKITSVHCQRKDIFLAPDSVMAVQETFLSALNSSPHTYSKWQNN